MKIQRSNNHQSDSFTIEDVIEIPSTAGKIVKDDTSLNVHADHRQEVVGGIIGTDDRQAFYYDGHPYHHIGMLRSGNKFSTAILIAPRYVLCCYHGLTFNHNGILSRTTFMPSYCGLDNADTTPHGTLEVTNAYFIGSHRPNDNNLRTSAVDLAIIELADRHPDAIDGNYPIASPFIETWEDYAIWSHVGYPIDINITTIQNEITIRDASYFNFIDSVGQVVPGKLFFTDADVSYGQSGGPLFQFNYEDNTMYVIGILSYGNGGQSGFAGYTNEFYTLQQYLIGL